MRTLPALLAALILAAPAFAQKDAASLQGLFRNDLNVVLQGASTVPVSVVNAADFGDFDQARPGAADTFSTMFGPVAASTGVAQGAGGSGSLVSQTTDWGQAFVDGQAPTELAGVRVLVGGVASPISFTGLGVDFSREFDQINFVLPRLGAENFGQPVTVQVFKDGELAGETSIIYGEFSPAFFTFGVRDGTTFLAAAQADFSAFVAATDFFGVPTVNGIPVRPAQSGDLVSFFGTGFGETTPDIPIGQIVTEVTNLKSVVEVRIAGMAADVSFAGRAGNLADIYQFNVTIPAGTPDGNASVEATIGGLTTAMGVIPIDNSTVAVSVGR